LGFIFTYVRIIVLRNHICQYHYVTYMHFHKCFPSLKIDENITSLKILLKSIVNNFFNETLQGLFNSCHTFHTCKQFTPQWPISTWQGIIIHLCANVSSHYYVIMCANVPIFIATHQCASLLFQRPNCKFFGLLTPKHSRCEPFKPPTHEH
jgi:hypothetical protein